jgi:carboxypeptidase Taq
MNAYKTVEKFLRRVSRLQHLNAMAGWDQAVMMPPGGAEARGAAMSELAVVVVETMHSPQLADALKAAEDEAHMLDEWQKANLREAKAFHARFTAVDPKLVEELTSTALSTEVAWRELRHQNNWKDFAPRLKKLLSLVREESRQRSMATGLPPYEALMSLYEPGLRLETVEKVFGELGRVLPGVLNEILEVQPRRNSVELGRKVPVERQRGMMKQFMDWIGFSFHHGRLDESHHPFCGGVPQDVRLTTRYSEEDFLSGLMGVMHETGHARYEQGLPSQWADQPVGTARGMAMHESQSLFVEMQIGRSREFFNYATPILKENLADSNDPKDFWTARNLFHLGSKVAPGLIRVDADEVTYPAHIILRFEIEKALIEGQMEVEDLPEIWDQKMRLLLGVSTLGDDRNGCMQDVHWPSGAFGYFPSYTLGALVAAQLFAELEKEQPAVRENIAKGEIAPVMAWLKTNVWENASKYPTEELLKKVTGQGFTCAPFISHVRDRYLRD